MYVYLDMCSLQRPLDDQSQVRIRFETQAILEILALCDTGRANICGSEALDFEVDACTDAVRRDFSRSALAKAGKFVKASEDVTARAKLFIASGVKPLDALHLASAVVVQADYFCTCDDRLLKKSRTVDTTPTKVVSPLELAAELLV